MKNKPAPINAVGYCRRSTRDRQEMSIFNQKVVIEKFCRANNLKLIKYFIDDGISGTDTRSRKAFLDMISEGTSKDCPFSVVVCLDISRFGRLPPDQSAHYEFLLWKNNVKVVYVAENLSGENTLADKIIKSIQRIWAEQFSKDQAKKTIRGAITYSRLGYSVGGQAPFGYSRLLVDKNGNPIKILKPGQRKSEKAEHVRYVLGDPEKVKVVKKIFDLVGNKGFGIRRVANFLNSRKISSPRGGRWETSTVYSLLLNPAYIGHKVWNRADRAFSFAWSHDAIDVKIGEKKTKITRWKDKSQWYICENAHKAIIGEGLFNKVQQKFKVRKEYFSSNKIKRVKKSIKKKYRKNSMRKNLILTKIKSHELPTLGALAENFKVHRRTVERDIEELKSEGKIRFIGPKRIGHYELLKNCHAKMS